MTSRPDDRSARALELHLAGASYQVIADQIGAASKATAHKLVREALDALVMPVPTEHTTTEIARLDAMLTGLWPKARRGDVQAVDRVLKIEERRTALLGLEAVASGPAPQKATGLSDFEKRLRDRERSVRSRQRSKSG